MADDRKKSGAPDTFYLNKVYRDARSLFTYTTQPVREAVSSCCVVLDASTLLEPYESDSQNLLSELRKIYEQLANESRLIVPGQAAREFAKNRLRKLADIREAVQRSSANGARAPLKSVYAEREGYLRMRAAAEDVNKAVSRYQKAAEDFAREVGEWIYSDPLYELYGDIFTPEVVLDPEVDENDIDADMQWRAALRLPPGFHDVDKIDRGVGDLLIWRTILAVGRDRNRDVLFVTQDGKNDWSIRSGKTPVYPREELMEEFRRESGGKAFYIATLSELLSQLKADDRVVADVRRTEGAQVELLSHLFEESVRPAVIKWLTSHFSNVTSIMEVTNTEYRVTYGGGPLAGVVIEVLPPGAGLVTAILRTRAAFERLAKWPLTEVLTRRLVVLVVPPGTFPLSGIDDTNVLAEAVPSGTNMVLGTVDNGWFTQNVFFGYEQ